MMYWKKWKLVRTDGTPTKDFIGTGQLKFKNGNFYNHSYYIQDKYQLVLLDNGAVGILYGFRSQYGSFFEVIDHKGWEVEFRD
jgi:hypothetical protein